ncbi:MAG: hypothetical protein ACO1N9_06525 [Flavobacterium sp.]
MAKITYYLGAGASYHSCPILNQQAEMMIKLAEFELQKSSAIRPQSSGITLSQHKYFFSDSEFKQLRTEKHQILWYIGYFGKKALEFNTIDTYARKLFLTNQIEDLRLLKMAVSVFFDLWENFQDRYKVISKTTKDDSGDKFRPIDQRYTALFSILLDNENGKIQMNNNFKFITWNYDLQLENAFKSFLKHDEIESLNQLNENYFRFKDDNIQNEVNNVFHLNGHRGFFLDKKKGTFELNAANDFNEYWNQLQGLLQSTKNGSANFDQYIKYAWEHQLNSKMYSSISDIMSQTDILVIIGYSFPPFNRKIDQYLFSKLDVNRLTKIIYQDPNANSSIIENLFQYPDMIKRKIKILNDDNALTWFNLPNEHFISQEEYDSSPTYSS